MVMKKNPALRSQRVGAGQWVTSIIIIILVITVIRSLTGSDPDLLNNEAASAGFRGNYAYV